MTERLGSAGRRRSRLVRLRPETSDDGIRAMAEHLSKMLGVDFEVARWVLVNLGRPKKTA